MAARRWHRLRHRIPSEAFSRLNKRSLPPLTSPHTLHARAPERCLTHCTTSQFDDMLKQLHELESTINTAYAEDTRRLPTHS